MKDWRSYFQVNFLVNKFDSIRSFDLSLPMRAWKIADIAIPSILIASLFINILSLAFPLALLQIYDRIIPNNAINTLFLLILGVGSALLLEAILRICRAYVSAWSDAKFEHITGCEAFESLLTSHLLDYEKDGPGVHLERLNAIQNLRDFYLGQGLTALLDVPFVVIFLILISYIAGWLVLIPIIILAVFGITAVYLGKDMHQLLEDKRTHDDRRFNFIIETLTKIETIKTMAMETQILRRYERLQDKNAIFDHLSSLKSAQTMTLSILVSQIILVLVVAFGSSMVIDGYLTIGGLAACTLLAGRCIQPINHAVSIWSRLQRVQLAETKLVEALKFKSEPQDPKNELIKLNGDIQLKNLAFRYQDTDSFLLNNINLTIKANDIIAINGDNQGGKTTLLWLILGILKPTKGEIFIDDLPIQQYDALELRNQIAYLPQQGQLLRGSILENLTLFNEQQYDKKAKELVKQLGLDPIIRQMPQGYNTEVANQATDPIPNGIRQRISIAQGLVHDPSIVLFDEANMSIDYQGDEALKKLLKSMIGQKTMILISQRPSIIELASVNYELKNGELRKQ